MKKGLKRLSGDTFLPRSRDGRSSSLMKKGLKHPEALLCGDVQHPGRSSSLMKKGLKQDGIDECLADRPFVSQQLPDEEGIET